MGRRVKAAFTAWLQAEENQNVAANKKVVQIFYITASGTERERFKALCAEHKAKSAPKEA